MGLLPTKFPSEVLPSAFTTCRVARVIPPRLSPSAPDGPDACAGVCVRETFNTQPMSRSDLSALMGTDLCTNELLDSGGWRASTVLSLL